MLQAAELMTKGFTLGQAVQRLGIQLPGPGEFAGALERVSQTSGAAREVAQKAMQLGYNYGGNILKQGIFYAGRIAATAMTPPVLVPVAIGATVILVGGVIYVATSDKPILPGPAMNKPKPEWKPVPSISYNPDDYFVFVLPQVSGGSIYIGQESRLKTMHPCDMPGGGLCGQTDPPLTYERKSPGFKNYDDAEKAWCAELKGKEKKNFPTAGDQKANVYGGWYWIGTAPDCQPA
jgi:hypothetical protein